jgi:hypothetical protein
MLAGNEEQGLNHKVHKEGTKFTKMFFEWFWVNEKFYKQW